VKEIPDPADLLSANEAEGDKPAKKPRKQRKDKGVPKGKRVKKDEAEKDEPMEEAPDAPGPESLAAKEEDEEDYDEE